MAAVIRDVKKLYFLKGETVRALRGVSFQIPVGDYVTIMGPSGSGEKHPAEPAGLPRPARLPVRFCWELTTSPTCLTMPVLKSALRESGSSFNHTT